MTTALDTIKGALRALKVIASGEPIDGSMTEDALFSLNQMLHGWRNRNVDLDHVDLEQTDDLKMDKRHHEGVMYLLAVRLAPEYDEPVSAEVATLADSGWRGIQSHYAVPGQLNVGELGRMPSQRIF